MKIFRKKYLNLFNELKLNLTINDNYIFQNIDTVELKFKNLISKLNLNNYVIIHFDEKWLDVDKVEDKLSAALINFEKNKNKNNNSTL